MIGVGAMVLYRVLLRVYPRSYRAEFEAEMQAVFAEILNEAAQQGLWALVGVGLREMSQWPKTLLQAHWLAWRERTRATAQLPVSILPAPALPPPAPDGRTSWQQAGLETSLFLVVGVMLMVTTYLPAAGPALSWHRNLDVACAALAWLALSGLLIGLAHGLPRWAYPLGGLLLGYSFMSASTPGLRLFMGASLLASAALAISAALVNSCYGALPLLLRRMGQSLWLDWSRLSFGIYGAMPLLILTAFDDARFHNRTPYVAISALLMVAGALAYSRSRPRALQLMTLWGGVSLALWPALLDQPLFGHGSASWPWPLISSLGFAQIGWMLRLWASVTALMVAPLLLGLARRALEPRRAARGGGS